MWLLAWLLVRFVLLFAMSFVGCDACVLVCVSKLRDTFAVVDAFVCLCLLLPDCLCICLFVWFRATLCVFACFDNCVFVCFVCELFHLCALVVCVLCARLRCLLCLRCVRCVRVRFFVSMFACLMCVMR